MSKLVYMIRTDTTMEPNSKMHGYIESKKLAIIGETENQLLLESCKGWPKVVLKTQVEGRMPYSSSTHKYGLGTTPNEARTRLINKIESEIDSMVVRVQDIKDHVIKS